MSSFITGILKASHINTFYEPRYNLLKMTMTYFMEPSILLLYGDSEVLLENVLIEASC